ncbi:MAG: hypothetical protein DWI57_03900 [Chloroflexi bacterium]|nr:MAG: hypothetical protein DWI57_03900 [Chloroflexota bacterium]
MTYTISKANKQQIGAILEMMLDGVSSDPTSIAALGKKWWQRIPFRYLLGPRMLTNQMTSFAAEKEGRVVGYLVLQYEGDVAGTFDWAVTEPLDGEGLEILADLLEAALDHAEQRGDTPLAYFGMQQDTDPRVAGLLVELGFWLADYQAVQMRISLPLAESTPLPAGIVVTPQIAQRFGNRLAEFVRMDYDLPDPEDEDAVTDALAVDEHEYQGLSLVERVEAICSLHESTLRASKVYLIEEEGEPVGIVQEFNWRDELRLLIALEPFLWGTATEQKLVAAMPQFVGKAAGYLRVRTFSSDHLATSRESFEALGLRWEEAPWQRWVVRL